MISPKQALQNTSDKEQAEVTRLEKYFNERLVEFDGLPIEIWIDSTTTRIETRLVNMLQSSGWNVVTRRVSDPTDSGTVFTCSMPDEDARL